MVTLSAKAGNSVVDELDVEVKVAAKLGFLVGSNTGATVTMNDPVFNEVWTVPVNQPVIFQVTPRSGTNLSLMGRSGVPYSRSASSLDTMGSSSTDGGSLVVKLQQGMSGDITYMLAQPSPLPSPLTLKAKVQAQ